MNITISTKNFNASENLRDTIESKLSRLDKYFSDNVTASVTLSSEGGRQTIETTVNATGMIFRAEETTQDKDVYNSIDRIVDKLNNQMGKHHNKAAHHHKDNKSDRFDEAEDVSV